RAPDHLRRTLRRCDPEVIARRIQASDHWPDQARGESDYPGVYRNFPAPEAVGRRDPAGGYNGPPRRGGGGVCAECEGFRLTEDNARDLASHWIRADSVVRESGSAPRIALELLACDWCSLRSCKYRCRDRHVP